MIIGDQRLESGLNWLAAWTYISFFQQYKEGSRQHSSDDSISFEGIVSLPN